MDAPRWVQRYKSFVTPAQSKQEAVLSYSNGVETVDGSFSISFETLLKRLSNPERPIEGDFHFAKGELMVIASRVWLKQGYMTVNEAMQWSEYWPRTAHSLGQVILQVQAHFTGCVLAMYESKEQDNQGLISGHDRTV
jgi:hypothetical protein